MSIADFLVSPAVQELLKVTFAGPATAFTAAELAKLTKTDPAETERLLTHLLDSGVFAQGKAPADAPATFCVDVSFAFYPELRRMALKSFAAAEPLRAMLRSRFRGQIRRAFFLGEDSTTSTFALLLVYEGAAPDREALDSALKKLLKTGAIRQHVQAHVIPESRFLALKPRDPLHTLLAADTCVELIAPSTTRPKAKAATAPIGLLEAARRRWSEMRK